MFTKICHVVIIGGRKLRRYLSFEEEIFIGVLNSEALSLKRLFVKLGANVEGRNDVLMFMTMAIMTAMEIVQIRLNGSSFSLTNIHSGMKVSPKSKKMSAQEEPLS